MSKRKGSALARQSKRHKSDDYNDGKTDLQRELELYDQTKNQQEQDEFLRAQHELKREQQQQITNTNNSFTSSGIDLGTPFSDDDDDEEEDIDYHRNNNIRNGDSDSDYHDDSHDYVHPERSVQIDYSANSNNDNDNVLTLRDLRAHQMTRKSLESICSEPYFNSFIGRDVSGGLPGLFCRIYIGDRSTSSGENEAIYRVCEMIGTEDWRRRYHLSDRRRTVNVGLLIAHGSAERVFKITQTSNTAFTEKEFIQWKQTMNDDGLPLPTKDDLSFAYLNAVKRHKNFKYDIEQIAIMREKKNKNYNAAELANPHKEGLRINTLIQSLAEDDIEQRRRLQIYLNDINTEIERRNSQQSQSIKVSIASINEKNKIKNKKLMLKHREKERKMQHNTMDPFTRAITAPKIESFKPNIEIIPNKEILLKKEDILPKKIIINENNNNIIHCVAKEFIKNYCITTHDQVQKEPIFGRNTNKSKYANKYQRKPKNIQIISIDHYLKTKKYSAM